MKTIEIVSGSQKAQFTTKGVTLDGNEYLYINMSDVRHDPQNRVYTFIYGNEAKVVPYEEKDAKTLSVIFTQVHSLEAKRRARQAAAAQAAAVQAAAQTASASPAAHNTPAPQNPGMTSQQVNQPAAGQNINPQAPAQQTASPQDQNMASQQTAGIPNQNKNSQTSAALNASAGPNAAANLNNAAAPQQENSDALGFQPVFRNSPNSAAPAGMPLQQNNAAENTSVCQHEPPAEQTASDTPEPGTFTPPAEAADPKAARRAEKERLKAEKARLKAEKRDAKERIKAEKRAAREAKKSGGAQDAAAEPIDSETAVSAPASEVSSETPAFSNENTEDTALSDERGETPAVSSENGESTADAGSAKKSRLKKSLIIFGIIIIAFALIAAVRFFVLGTSDSPSDNNPSTTNTQQYQDMDELIEDMS